jgi:O-antigen/teichoic acid export membrane protein
MLLRSIFGYAPSNLIPAAVAVAMIAVFSRLLPPDEFGRYAVGQSLVLIGQALAFYGLQVSLTRFYARQQEIDGGARLLATGYACYAGCAAAAAALLAIGILVLDPEPRLAATLWLALPVLLLRGLVTINLAAHRGALRVARYNLVECGHNLAGFAFSLLLVGHYGAGAEGLMLGLLGGACIGLLPDLRLMARSLGRPDPAILREMRAFGGPLVVCYALNSAQAYADRLLLERFAGAAVVGLYAAAAGIVDRAVTLVFMAVTLGAFPLAIEALERHGVEAARRQLLANATALLALGVPAATGLACLSVPIATVLVGPDYRAGVIAVMPWIALLSLLRGFTIHYLDHALHLGRRTDLFLYTVGPAAALSLTLNLLLIPWLGLAGAVVTALASQTLALLSTAVIGRRVFPIGFPVGQAARVAAATIVMAGALRLLDPAPDIEGLALAVASGVLAYAAAALMVNVGGARSWLAGQARCRWQAIRAPALGA